MALSRKIRVVMAEDSAADAELARHALRRARIAADVVVAATEEDFRQALIATPADIVISDNSMPQFSGKDALLIASELAPAAPFVFLSGSVAERMAIDEELSRATMCLDKKDLDRLGAVVASLLRK